MWVFSGDCVDELLLFAYVLIFPKSNLLFQDEAVMFRENGVNPIPSGFIAELKTLEVLNITGQLIQWKHTHTHTHTHPKSDTMNQQ